MSFCKPATSSETGWLLCWSVGWLLPLLNLRARERVAVTTGALVFGLGETLIAAVQAWRGRPFHYNTETPFDEGIFVLSGTEAGVFFISLPVLIAASLRLQTLEPSLLSVRTGAGSILLRTL